MKRIKTIFADKFESVYRVSNESYHAEMMQYYEEVLAQSARNYAMTSDKKWEQRYIEMEKMSDKLLKDAIKKADSANKDFFSKMDVSNQKLVKMEYLVIDFVNDNKFKHAIELLESEEYLQERKVLARGLEIFVKEHYEKESDSWMLSKAVREIVELERRLAMLEYEHEEEEKLSIIGQLASRLAHDLRNPLSVISAEIELIKLRDPNPNEKMQKSQDRINRSIQKMFHQLDDVMDFVRIKPLCIKNLSMRDLLRSSIKSLLVPSEIKINLPENDCVIYVDSIQMGIVFNNLIFNAIQAMDESGEINIKISENTENTVIEIQDSGPGIPEKNLETIFEPLFTTKQTGTGLGLVSCRTIVEQHGGTISVKNNPTTFTVMIPKI